MTFFTIHFESLGIKSPRNDLSIRLQLSNMPFYEAKRGGVGGGA